MNKKAIIYARVSSKEQEKEGFSIPAQLKFLREYAKRNNFTVVKEFAEAETAKQKGRPVFTEMLTYLSNNIDVKDVLVEKTDRLYRNFKDYVILEDYDLSTHLVKEGEILNKDSRSHQKFIHGVKVLMAKNYIDNLSEEVKKGFQEKVEQGGYPHAAPMGYKNNKELHTIEIEEHGSRMIKAMFEFYATGNYSLWTLRKKVIDEGLTAHYRDKKIPTSMVGRILRNPIYYGVIPFKGKIYTGNHGAIISKELFDIVQEILDSNAKRKSKAARKFTYTGMINCSNCGCLITAELKKGKYIYYHCTNAKRNCTKEYIREEVIEKQFEGILKILKMDEKGLELTRDALRLSFVDEKRYHDNMIAKLESELNISQERFDKVYMDKIDGKISEDFWSRKSKDFTTQQDKIIEAIELHKKANRNYFDGGIRLLDLADKAYELYVQQNPEEKREFLNYIISNSVISGSNLSVELKEPFFSVAECVKSGDYLGR